MTTIPLSNLVDTLRTCHLLTAAQLGELGKYISGNGNDSREIAAELVKRAWLTPFQAQEILMGRGSELLFGSAPYVLLERLGGGGSSQVYKARHHTMDRLVALKLLRQDLRADAEAVGRFDREAQVISQLDHPCIIRAYDSGTAGVTHFLVLEYIEGSDLERLVRRGGPLPVPQACDFIRQAALGLQYAHERGLVHRDIKPSNLVVSEPGIPAESPSGASLGPTPWGTIKILDLGLARLQQPAGGRPSNLTVLGGDNAVQGTPDYISPEQAMAFHNADIRSDIYSLGCTFFYLLSARPPFGGTLSQKLIRHHQAEPPPIAKERSDVPAKVAAILTKMLAKRPADRYQQPGEVAQELAAALANMGTSGAAPRTPAARPPSTAEIAKTPTVQSALLLANGPAGTGMTRSQPPPTRWSSRRRRVALLLAGTFLVLGCGVLAWSLFGGHAGSRAHASVSRVAATEREPEPVFLSDLPERDVAVGYGRFGKKGDLGYEGKHIVVKGVAVAHGLSMHPPGNGSARVTYDLDRGYRTFKAAVAINDDGPGSESALTFKVWGDDKCLWQSSPLKKRGEVQECTVEIAPVDRLKLEVHCPGANGVAHAVWVEPRIVK